MRHQPGWIKHFGISREPVIGSDELVDNKQVSWRGTPTYLLGCTLQTSQVEVTISGLGYYWQSDDYIVPMSTSGTFQGKRVARRIMREIEPTDSRVYVRSTPGTLAIQFNSDAGTAILPSQHGLWLVAEIENEKTCKWYFSSRRF